MTGSELRAGRVALNQSLFREANEAIEEKAEDVGFGGEIPFLCECPAIDCMTVVPLRFAAYEHVRSSDRWFLVHPGHEERSGRWERVAEQHRAYLIVEKLDEAGDLAEELAEQSLD